MSSPNEVVESSVVIDDLFMSNLDNNAVMDINITFEKESDEFEEIIYVAQTNPLETSTIKTKETNNLVDSFEELYNPFKAKDILHHALTESEDRVISNIGPFSDNRPICECSTVRQLMANTDARFLLSLLPDMEEMNKKQKTVFKNRVCQLIERILMGVTIDVEM